MEDDDESVVKKRPADTDISDLDDSQNVSPEDNKISKKPCFPKMQTGNGGPVDSFYREAERQRILQILLDETNRYAEQVETEFKKLLDHFSK